MRALKLLIPSVGRPTHPSLIACLRNNGEREVSIVGVDMDADGLGPHIVDRFYKVPPRSEPAYIEEILNICESESVDVYYAIGEEETIAAAERMSDFQDIGASVITPGTPDALRIATNKCLWHDYLAERGISHADYRSVHSLEEVGEAAHALGYPREDVFVKPAVSRGGRGARILTSKDLSRSYYSDRSSEPPLSLESFCDMLAPLASGGFASLLMMEYLPGTSYSVDVLSANGQAIYVIPKIRIAGSASNTVVGQVSLDRDVIQMAEAICEAFGFSYLQNYEMKLNRHRKPMVYDINPRGGASVACCAAAGVNIAYYAVKMAVGETIPRREIRDGVKMIRYYSELYS